MITDVNPWRLEFARKINPEIHTVNVSTESLKDKMHEIGMNEGFDVGFEMSGVESAFGQMVDTMIMGGNIAMLGLPPRPFPVDFGKVVLKALTIRGIYGREMYDTWYKMLAMLDNGLDMSGMITHRFSCDDYQQAFDVMLTGQCGNCLLYTSPSPRDQRGSRMPSSA